MTTDGSNAMSDRLAAIGGTVLPARVPNLAAAAMYYVTTLKWPVFPLKARGKTPLTAHGFQDATLDPAQVTAWWTKWPDANLAVPTGPRASGGCGYDVIDADGPDGLAAWNRIKHRQCPPGCSGAAFCDATGGFDVRAEAITPGNSSVGRGSGRHVYIPASGQGNSARINGQPLDVRGRSGYVVAVPSVNLVGDAYSWVKAPVAS